MPSVSLVALPGRPLSRSRCGPVVSPGYSGCVWLYPQIVSVALAGHVREVCPLGLAWPSSSRAVDVPPSWPANHISSTDRTLPIQGSSTGLVVLRTTMVFGLAVATALTRLVLAADSEETPAMVAGVVPYGLGMVVEAPESLRNTTAALLPLAAAAA